MQLVLRQYETSLRNHITELVTIQSTQYWGNCTLFCTYIFRLMKVTKVTRSRIFVILLHDFEY